MASDRPHGHRLQVMCKMLPPAIQRHLNLLVSDVSHHSPEYVSREPCPLGFGISRDSSEYGMIGNNRRPKLSFIRL